jgi:hypothetical protein
MKSEYSFLNAKELDLDGHIIKGVIEVFSDLVCFETFANLST